MRRLNFVIYVASALLTTSSGALAAEHELPTSQLSTTEPIGDIFTADLVLSDEALRSHAGGTETSVDLNNLGVNISTTTGIVDNNSADGSVTGTIADNVIGQNSGFTTVFINSGNNVLFQNTLQLNIFTGTE